VIEKGRRKQDRENWGGKQRGLGTRASEEMRDWSKKHGQRKIAAIIRQLLLLKIIQESPECASTQLRGMVKKT